MLLLMHHEDCFLQAKSCSAGVLTIGYGHTTTIGKPIVVSGMKITYPEAVILLYKDTKKVYDGMQSVQQFDWLQQAALVSFAYNIGIESFNQSTACKRASIRDVLYRDYSVALNMQRWNKIGKTTAPGLVRRRSEEAWTLLWRQHVMEIVAKNAPYLMRGLLIRHTVV